MTDKVRSLKRDGALSTSRGLGLVGGRASTMTWDLERQAGRFGDMLGKVEGVSGHWLPISPEYERRLSAENELRL